MKILGMSQDGHNSSIALVKDGKIEFASCEERFSRQKLTPEFPFGAIKHAMDKHEATLDAVDHVAVSWNSLVNAGSRRRGFQNRRWKPESLYQVPMKLEMSYGLSDSEWVHTQVKYPSRSKPLSIWFLNHHLCHAASVVYPSGFEDCAFLILDGNGERETSTIGTFDGSSIERLFVTEYPMSPGLVYGSVTEYLGYKFNEEEWKVMALGTVRPPNPRSEKFREIFEKVIYAEEDGRIVVDLKFFEYGLDRAKVYSPYMVETFGPARPKRKDAEILDHHYDVAYGLQKAFEKLFVDVARAVRKRTNKTRLALAGGSAMNCVANGALEQSGIFEELYIGGWPADEGTSIGACYLLGDMLDCRWRVPRMHTTAFGRSFSDEEVEAVLTRCEWRARARKMETREQMVEETAKMIAAGKVVGWFQGREEFGQRALGSRSILADPRDPTMKDKLNAKIKYREAFRPFAPSVLLEEANNWFEMGRIKDVSMMEKTVSVREDKRSKIPAPTHFDGTARIHTVRKDVNPLYHEMISAFYRLTGVPMVVNTSFNLAGEPIVSTVDDALRTFASSGIDALVVGSFVISK